VTDAAAGDDVLLLERDRVLARLLADAEAACGPAAWPRVEAVVTALVELYGSGLERVLVLARAAALDRESLDDDLAADEVVSSLLLLHDLHPLALEKRIERALERVREEVPHAGALSVVGVTDGVVQLRAVQPGAQLPTSHVVARAIEREAPELAGVQIDGAPPARADGLLPVERLVRGARA
jgi:hypothetical protein